MTETKYISSKMAAAHCLPDQEGLVKRLRWLYVWKYGHIQSMVGGKLL